MDRTARIFDALDYERLAAIYCDAGGDAFWREHRGPAQTLGARWAQELGRRLSTSGPSLYVGAGVAEIPAIVHEVFELGRTVVATNLRADECEVLDRALREVGIAATELTFEPCDVAAVAARGPFDHVSMVSVLTDPEAWPETSGVTYGRLPPVLLDVAAFAAEREALNALVATALGVLELPGTVTTTVEEVPWIVHWAGEHGVTVDADDVVVETAIVGDPLGFLRLTAS